MKDSNGEKICFITSSCILKQGSQNSIFRDFSELYRVFGSEECPLKMNEWRFSGLRNTKWLCWVPFSLYYLTFICLLILEFSFCTLDITDLNKPAYMCFTIPIWKRWKMEYRSMLRIPLIIRIYKGRKIFRKDTLHFPTI